MDWLSTFAVSPTVVAAIAACASALYAFKSTRVANRAYSLALRQERRLSPALELYVQSSQKLAVKSPDVRVYVFEIMVTNKSDSPNSLRELELKVTYRHGHGPASNVGIPHDSILSTPGDNPGTAPIQIPCAIGAHEVVSGLAQFQMPLELLKESQDETYTLRLLDIFNHAIEYESILIREKASE